MEWSGEQRGFVIETFFKNRVSLIAIQRAFRTRFQLRRCGRVPSRNEILRWMDSVPAILKKNLPGRPKTVRTSVNVEAVRQSVVRSPQRSARKHAFAMRLSNTMIRCILHSDLKFHPYKMAIVQKIHAQAWENHVNSLPAYYC